MDAVFIFCGTEIGGMPPGEFDRLIMGFGEPLAREKHFWIIETKKKPSEIRDALLAKLDEYDLLLVGQVGPELAVGNWAADSIASLAERFKVDRR